MEKDAAWCLEHPYKPENNMNTFSCTIEELQEFYDSEFKRLMDYRKEELVRMILGRRPF